MQTNDTIRRAMMRTPQPALPASFTPQLMVRVRRRNRLRTLLNNAAITAAAILVTAAAIAALVWALPEKSLTHLIPKMPPMPALPHIEMTDALQNQISYWTIIFGSMLLLLTADLLLRQHMRRRRRHTK